MSERPRPVLMVSAGFHPAVGGAEKQALELSAALKRRGVEVLVLTRRLPGLAAKDEVRGVAVRRLWCAGTGLVNALTFMASLFWTLWEEAGSARAIHVHLAGSPALAAALAGRLSLTPVFVKLGGGRGIGELAASSRTWSGRLKLAALSWLAPRFIAVTQDLALEAREFLGQVPLTVMPNGVDTARYAPSDAARKAALRKALGWPPSGLVFLYAGRLSPEKRLPWFLERWAASGAAARSCVAIVGDGPERGALEALRGRLGAEAVLLRPAMEAVEEAYAAADAFVLPSISEGLSNALLEAMSSGLAVVGSRVGGTAEAVAEGESGLLFAPEDGRGLEAALERLARDPGEARRLGAGGRRAALESFSLDAVAARCERLYAGLE